MPKLYIPLLAMLSVAALAAPALADSVALTNDGIQINVGQSGPLAVAWPVFLTTSGQETGKVLQATGGGSTENVTYDNGTTAAVTLDAATGVVHLDFAKLPPGVLKYRLDMKIPFNYDDGGQWSMGADSMKPFPADLPDNPNFYQGNVTAFSLKDSQGAQLNVTVPQYSFQQLTDCRKWNWKIFNWSEFAVIDPNNPHQDYSFTLGKAPATSPIVRVDQFGQPTHFDYPGKITSVDQLKQDIAAESAFDSALPAPKRDIYGGLPGSAAKYGLKNTGFFHVEKHGTQWILVDPAGNAYFQLGVCEVGPGDDYTKIAGRENIYTWLPPTTGDLATAYQPNSGNTNLSFFLANRIKKYGKPFDQGEFDTASIARMRQWGFNCVGPFSHDSPEIKAANFGYAGSLPVWDGVRQIPGMPSTWDPFDKNNQAAIDHNFSKSIADSANDPLIFGYYLCNEPLYENLPNVVPKLDGTYACKQRLVADLTAKYKTIDAFNSAWGMTAKSFDDLDNTPLPVTTKAAQADVKTYTDEFFETFYKFVSDTFHKYDHHHMLIGNRFQSGTINNEQMCRIAGKYLDIVSFNYYTCTIDPDFMKRIYGWTGRPMVLSEFYFDSPKTSGLSGGNMDFATQELRGLAYRDYIEHAAAMGFVVGTEWFTQVDQSVTGRSFEGYNGESGNSGLIGVTDRPYYDAVKVMAAANFGIYDVELGHKPPYTLDDPRFQQLSTLKQSVVIERAAGHVAMDGTAGGFPGVPATQITGKRLVLGSDSTGFEANYKLCWDDTNLYVYADISDPTPMKNDNTNDGIWSGDAVELFIGPQQPDTDGELLPGDRHVLLSGGKVNGQFGSYIALGPTHDGCTVISVPKVSGDGYTLEAAIPFAALGFTPKENQAIRFDIAIDDSADGKARIRQLVWNGSARDSGDRSGWATARFVK